MDKNTQMDSELEKMLARNHTNYVVNKFEEKYCKPTTYTGKIDRKAKRNIKAFF